VNGCCRKEVDAALFNTVLYNDVISAKPLPEWHLNCDLFKKTYDTKTEIRRIQDLFPQGRCKNRQEKKPGYLSQSGSSKKA
jgi:hypothetical protein